jgi:hypothetical protein
LTMIFSPVDFADNVDFLLRFINCIARAIN